MQKIRSPWHARQGSSSQVPPGLAVGRYYRISESRIFFEINRVCAVCEGPADPEGYPIGQRDHSKGIL